MVLGNPYGRVGRPPKGVTAYMLRTATLEGLEDPLPPHPAPVTDRKATELKSGRRGGGQSLDFDTVVLKI